MHRVNYSPSPGQKTDPLIGALEDFMSLEITLHNRIRFLHRGIRDYQQITIYKTLLQHCNIVRTTVTELQEFLQPLTEIESILEPLVAAEKDFTSIVRFSVEAIRQLSEQHKDLMQICREMNQKLKVGMEGEKLSGMIGTFADRHEIMSQRLREWLKGQAD